MTTGALRQVVRRRSRPWTAFGPIWWVAIGVLVVYAFYIAFGQLFLPPANVIDTSQIQQGPTLAHLFGTDRVGMDVFANLAVAGRLTVLISFSAMLISIVVGTVWGFVAAGFGGWLDEVLMRIGDAVFAIPMILFAMIFVAAFGASVPGLIVILGLLMSPATARVVRSQVMAELESDYVLGLRAVGAGRLRVLFTEVLPNAWGVLLAQATLNIATAVMAEAGLSFIGLGLTPPTYSWGTILREAYASILRNPTFTLFAALTITVFMAAINILGRETQRMVSRRSAG